MNLQCPNCQKLLTVQEHYAGQLMKCPLCKENFTVPSLPTNGGGEPALAPAFAASPAPPLPAGPEPYGLKSEPPAPAWSAPADAPAFPTAAPEPAFATGAPPPPPAWSSAAPGPAAGPSQSSAAAPTQKLAIVFDDKILRWVPPVALVLVFVLQFFSWVGVYPGGVPAVTQTAWGAAFGGYTAVRDLTTGPKDTYPLISDSDAKKGETSNEPGVSWLTLFYLLPFFLITLVVTLAVAALPFLKAVRLPPQVQQLLPWQWAIVAVLNAVCLLFLALQLVLNFSIESKAKAWIDTQPTVVVKKDASSKEVLQADVARGMMLDWLERRAWLWLVLVLHVLATAAAALVYVIEKRGPSHPLPRLELQW